MLKKKSKNYALSWATTRNLGDDLQSLALSRLLPRVDSILDRDNLPTHFPSSMRGFVHGWLSRDSYKEFSGSEMARALLPVSFHIVAPRLHMNNYWLDYFSKAPIVLTRDEHTANMLRVKDIDAQFGGCLTLLFNDLFLRPDTFEDYRLETRKPETERNDLSVVMPADLPEALVHDFPARVAYSLLWLTLIAGAREVNSQRLHVLLPAHSFGVALEPPLVPESGNWPTGSINRLTGFEALIGQDEGLQAGELFSEEEVYRRVQKTASWIEKWAGQSRNSNFPIPLQEPQEILPDLLSHLGIPEPEVAEQAYLRARTYFLRVFRNNNPGLSFQPSWL